MVLDFDDKLNPIIKEYLIDKNIKTKKKCSLANCSQLMNANYNNFICFYCSEKMENS